ncbi:MAG: EAL domain-containing protein [Burkholderiales bacterium]
MRISNFLALQPDQLADLLDPLPLSIFVKNRDSQILYINPACADLWGCQVEEILGTCGEGFFPAEQIKAFQLRDTAILMAGTSLEYEEPFWSAKHQSNRIGRTTKIPVRNSAGEPEFVFCFTEDITQATETEKALHASEARFEALVSNLQIGILSQGADDQILSCNRKALDLLGMTRDQLMGKSSLDPGWSVVGEDGQPLPLEEHPSIKAKRTGQPVRDVILGVNRPLLGGRIWLQVQAEPLFNPDGSLSHVAVSFVDISALQEARQHALEQQQALERQSAHLQAVVENMADAVVTIDAKGCIQSFNRAASDIFGFLPESVIGRNVSMLMPAPDSAQHDAYLARYAATREARILGMPREVQGRRSDGSVFPIHLSITPTNQGDAPMFVGVMRDITQRRQAEEEIRRLAFYDPLTGLPNRRLLVDRLEKALAAAARHGQHGAVMFIDLDHFKQLNDTLGHAVGDLLLQQVGSRLMGCIRQVDSAARLGGDEFVVLLSELDGQVTEAAMQAANVAEKIMATLEPSYLLGSQPYRITPSIGIAVFRDNEPVDELLKKADIAMYQAKSAGRNTVRFFDPQMQAAAMVRAEMEKEILISMAGEHFELHYQPQVNWQGRSIGVEALLRWRHPIKGMVMPGAFIPAAEESGLILPLGKWVMEEACRQLSRWSGQASAACWTVSVNVSALQLSQPNFVESVRRALLASGANPALLKIELTESVLAKDFEQFTAKMNELKTLGVGFSLDDFGTGYSSLAYLKQLPLDQLKIDRSFVRDLEVDASDAIIARSIVALGHALGLKVVAEGVETAAQRDVLLSFGCDYLQGYYFSRPRPAADLTD